MKLLEIIATGFFVGRFPVAPATWGSLLAIPIMILTYKSWTWILVTFLTLSVLGVISSHHMYKELGVEDPRCVVIDEIAAMYISLAGLEVNLRNLLLAFVLFRVFDILKPPPARRLEGLPGGWGIMADDLVASLYTLGVMHLIKGFL